MNILVTGGAGYIGSHTTLELLIAGHQVIILDNFSNSSPKAIERVLQICKDDELSEPPLTVVDGDICDQQKLKEVFSENSIDAVIHFAGLKAIGESVEKPLDYYKNNVQGSITLFQAMRESDVCHLIFE